MRNKLSEELLPRLFAATARSPLFPSPLTGSAPPPRPQTFVRVCSFLLVAELFDWRYLLAGIQAPNHRFLTLAPHYTVTAGDGCRKCLLGQSWRRRSGGGQLSSHSGPLICPLQPTENCPCPHPRPRPHPYPDPDALQTVTSLFPDTGPVKMRAFAPLMNAHGRGESFLAALAAWRISRLSSAF